LVALSVDAVLAVPACGGLSVSHDGSGEIGGTGAVRGTGGSKDGVGGTKQSAATGGTNSAGGGTRSASTGTSGTGGDKSTGAAAGTGGAIATGTGAANGIGGDTATGTGAANGTGGDVANGTGGGSVNSGCGSSENRVLVPNTTGWVDHVDACNNVGVQGLWYAFGDQYKGGSRGPTCLILGQHHPAECAQITTPDPTQMAFPNINGEMQTAGTVDQVLPCVAGSMAATIPTSGCPGGGAAGGYDFASMWGAGIGFDFNRGELPPEGEGTVYTFDTSRLLGIEFHVPTTTAEGPAYDFTISHLTFLRNL
jgi:hypothetical protein